MVCFMFFWRQDFDISKYGVGGKNAAFALGDDVCVMSRSRSAQNSSVHEMMLCKSQLEQADGENRYNFVQRNRAVSRFDQSLTKDTPSEGDILFLFM